MTRALLFAAHPDDLEVHMGASLLAMAADGWALHVVHATNGERGTRQPSTGTRRDEAERALGAITDELHWWALPDAGLAEAEGLGERVRELLAGLGPDVVFAPAPGDRHRDHAALGTAVWRARAEVPLWCWLDCSGREAPTHAFASELAWESKRALIECHASQIPSPGEPRGHLPAGLDIVERARQRDRELGRQLGRAWAEPFVRAGGGAVSGVGLLTDVSAFADAQISP